MSTHAIVTVSLGSLKDEVIQFKPALPDPIQRNVDRRGWGGGFKVFLEFDPRFRPYDWVCFPDDDCYDYDGRGVLVGEQLFWDHVEASAPDFVGRRTLVAAYVTGRFALEFEGMSERRIIERILDKFDEYYYWDGEFHRGYRRGRFLRHLLVDWSDNDFVRGTYSYPSPDFEGRRADDRNKIFMAGEAFPAPLNDGSGQYEDPGRR